MSELYHHGILGQRWGVRRYQNPDGTLTEAGRARYSSGAERKKFTQLAITSGRNDNSYKKLKGSVQVKAAAVSDGVRNAVKKCRDIDARTNKMQEDFYNNERLYEKYLQKAVDEAMESSTGVTRDWVYNWIKYDDGGQGHFDPFFQYMKDNPEVQERYSQLIHQYEQARKDLVQEAKKATESFLTDAADVPVRHYKGMPNMEYVRDRVAEIVAYEAKGPRQIKGGWQGL